MYSADLSEYNGVIQWTIAAQYLELAIIKAVGTVGTASGLPQGSTTGGLNNTDPCFRTNWQALAANRQIMRGAYLYLYMNDDPIIAAQQFLNVVKPEPCDLVALDLEDQVTDKARSGKSNGDLWPIVKTCLDVLEKGIGRKPFIYTSPGWWQYWFCKLIPADGIKPAHFEHPTWTADYPLWVAHYTAAAAPLIPPGWKDWIIWQYGADKVPGIGVSVGSNPNTDLNRRSMTIPQLRTFWRPTAAVIEPTLEEKVEILWKEHLQLLAGSQEVKA